VGCTFERYSWADHSTWAERDIVSLSLQWYALVGR